MGVPLQIRKPATLMFVTPRRPAMTLHGFLVPFINRSPALVRQVPVAGLLLDNPLFVCISLVYRTFYNLVLVLPARSHKFQDYLNSRTQRAFFRLRRAYSLFIF